MANRTIYGQQALFAGPSPSSGFHFIDSSGNLNNFHWSGLNNTNRLKNIEAVYDVSWNFAVNRLPILQIGSAGTIARPSIVPNPINLSLSYYIFDCTNLNNLGFCINTGGANVAFLSGIYTRESGQYNDKRNLFLATAPVGQDILYSKLPANVFADSNAYLYNVKGFGDCYVNSYSSKVSVGSIPEASLSFICENLNVTSSGTGAMIPSLQVKYRQELSGIFFNLPAASMSKPVIIPSNIKLNIDNPSQIFGFATDFSDLSIQGYQISTSFNRESLQSIGYKLPIDRTITFPIFVDLSFDTVFKTSQTGSVNNYLRTDLPYNINIVMQTGLQTKNDVMIYSFTGAKFISASYKHSIGSNVSASFSFQTEIHHKNLNQGFFVSGKVT